MCHIVTSVIDTVASDHGSTDCSRSISDLRSTRGVMGAETDNMSSLGGGCCYNHFHLILGGVIRQCCNMETQAYISLITLLRSDIGWCCQDPSTWQIGGPQYLSFLLLKYLFPIVHCGPTGSIIFLCSSFKLSPGRPRVFSGLQDYGL